MNHQFDDRERLLLARLLDDFRIAGLQLASYDMPPGSGSKSLAYIAVRAFRGLVSKYETWLQEHHTILGSSTALEILLIHNDPEYWVVRSAVIHFWFEEQGYVVPGPPMPKMKWISNGGFPRLVTAEEARALDGKSAA